VLLATPSGLLLAQAKPAPAEINYTKLFESAVADYNAGRNLEAEAKFRKVLQKHPNHIHSQRYRAMLKKRIREDAAVPIMKRRLHAITLEEVAFEEATLAEVMEYVTRSVKEISKGKVTPGLVIRGGDSVRERKLTFKTGPAPADRLIDTAASLTNTKVKYSDYALTFSPLPTAAEISAQAAQKLEEAEAKQRARAAADEANNADPFRKR
jgi:hypothetical protein